MLTKNEMQEIQDLKLRGYTKSEIPQYYIAQGRKPPSTPTIRNLGQKGSDLGPISFSSTDDSFTPSAVYSTLTKHPNKCIIQSS